jgi:hypothetical protein
MMSTRRDAPSAPRALRARHADLADETPMASAITSRVHTAAAIGSTLPLGFEIVSHCHRSLLADQGHDSTECALYPSHRALEGFRSDSPSRFGFSFASPWPGSIRVGSAKSLRATSPSSQGNTTLVAVPDRVMRASGRPSGLPFVSFYENEKVSVASGGLVVAQEELTRNSRRSGLPVVDHAADMRSVRLSARVLYCITYATSFALNHVSSRHLQRDALPVKSLE